MNNGNQSGYSTEAGHRGFTKREYYAGLAIQNTDLELYADKFGNKWAEHAAADAVKMADALLYALETMPIPESK